MLVYILFNVLLAVVDAVSDPLASVLCRSQCIDKCWEHCGALSNNSTSLKSLCNSNNCMEGCDVACKYFKQKQSPSKERLVFQDNPTFNGHLLKWKPVPNATLYSVNLYLNNGTMLNIAQTVSCKFKIPEKQLNSVTRIVVIAVNNIGAMGIANYDLNQEDYRRIDKKTAGSTLRQLREVFKHKDKFKKISPNHEEENMEKLIQNYSPDIWIAEDGTVKIHNTLVKTKLKWKYINNKICKNVHEFLIKWWIPDFNLEGNSLVNSSQPMELTHIDNHICFVQVKDIHSQMESQILILKKNHQDLSNVNISTSDTVIMYSVIYSVIINCFILASSSNYFVKTSVFNELIEKYGGFEVIN